MYRLDTAEIIREAKEMRAAEMQRIQGLMAKRLGLYLRLLGGSATDACNALQRPAMPRREQIRLSGECKCENSCWFVWSVCCGWCGGIGAA